MHATETHRLNLLQVTTKRFKSERVIPDSSSCDHTTSHPLVKFAHTYKAKRRKVLDPEKHMQRTMSQSTIAQSSTHLFLNMSSIPNLLRR